MFTITKIVNPRTGRAIDIGGPTYEKLTSKEIDMGIKLWRQRERQTEEKKKNDQIINPRSGRPIRINGPVYKKLTRQEKEEGVKLWNERDKKEMRNSEEKGECPICTIEKTVCVTNCCRQHMCKDCYISSISHDCPFCRGKDPIYLSAIENGEKIRKTAVLRMNAHVINAHVINDNEFENLYRMITFGYI